MIDCEQIIKNALGRDMSDQEIHDMFQQAKLLEDQVNAQNAINLSQQDLQKLSRKWASRQKLAALQKKVNTQRQTLARSRVLNYCLTEFKGLEAEGLYAVLVGSKYKRESGRFSVDARQRALTGEYLGGFEQDLKALGPAHYDILRKNKMAREIAGAMWLVEDKNNYHGPVEAMEIAEVMHKWSEQARKDANSAGAWIGKLKGFVVRQAHDPAKLNKAGYQNWKAFVEPRLDWKRIADGMFDDPAKAQQKEAFLYGSWKSLVDGIHLAPNSQMALQNPLVKMSIMGSEAARMSHERLLHFKTGFDWYDYNMKFGRGDLNDAFLRGLTSAAESTALMRTLGPSPQATFQWVYRQLGETLHKQGDVDGAAKVKKMWKPIADAMKEVDGTLNIEGNHTRAEIGRAIRAFQSLAKLGGATVSSITDMPSFAMEMKYQGHGFFAAFRDGLSYFLQGRGSAESQRVLSLCSVFFDGMTGQIASRFSGSDLPGKFTALQNAFFRVNGLTWWTDCWKRSACLVMAHDMALERGKTFAQLSRERKRLLGLYGIDAGRWELIRNGAQTMADGREYLTSEAALTIPDASLESYLRGKGQAVNDAAKDALRNELAERIRVMYRDRVQYAVLEPDAKNRRLLRQGTSSGTFVGEVIRFATQFKSFPTLFIQRPMAREIYGRGADTLGRGLLQSFVGSKAEGRNHFFEMFAAMTAMGYVAMTLKQLLAGKTPRDPTDTEHLAATILASAAQGGGIGIFGDFLFGARNRMGNTLTANAAGPFIGSLEQLADIGMRARDGDVDLAPNMVRWLWGQTPGNNLFYTKAAMDYLALNAFYEWQRPGYLRRMQRRVEKETGQRFLIDPRRFLHKAYGM